MGGDEWHYPPRLGVGRGDSDTVQMWIAAGGLDGPLALPQAGGLGDQAAVMMDAWRVIRATAAKWREEKRRAQQGGRD